MQPAIQELKLYAHSIKGVAANVSANIIKRIASEIEAAVKKGERDSLETLVTGLEEEFERFKISVVKIKNLYIE